MAPEALPKVCIIGAGSSGIAACKIFSEKGIPYDCYEASDRIGGMWVYNNKNGKSSAYKSLHINTSRDRMDYSDFPMPDHYPKFPSHYQIAEYFESYVDHFGFRDNIIFNTEVEHCERKQDGTWEVRLASGEVLNYDALVVANGHHWDPAWPEPGFPGEFSGEILHGHYYRTPNDPVNMYDKNIVVVGFGNTAMDVACELSRVGVARNLYLSTRSGGYIHPKYLGRLPIDEIGRHPAEPPGWFEKFMRLLPEQPFESIMTRMFGALVKHYVSSPETFGLPKPKHKYGETHPTISSEIHIRLASGDIQPKPNIRELQGHQVEFDDGTTVDADVIIYCTGYNISFPFFNDTFIKAEDNDIALYQRMFDPRYENLMFLALVQPLCAMMPIAEMQSKFIADYLKGLYHLPPAGNMEKEMLREHEHMKTKFTHSKRHTIEINCQKYTFDLRKELKKGHKRARKAGNTLPVAAKATV